MSYHKREIKKGEYGNVSKIREELEELEDALEQHNVIMAMCELSDIYGALEGVANALNIDIHDVAVMSDATKRAFESGHRK